MQKKPKYFPLFVVLIALCLYMAAAFYQITLPGLHHDEAQEAALMGMQLEKGLPVRLFRDTGFVVANRAFPLMVQDYIGALNAYLAWFAFGIGGVSVESLRSMTILTGMLTLMSAFFAARRLFGWQTAALTVLMLAVHPAFVFWTRQGVIVTSYTLTLTLAALWLMLRWWQGGAAWNLIMAAFLMGVGLWGKLLFIWFIGAVFIAGLVLNLPRFARWIRRRDSLRPEIRTPVYTIPLAVIFGIIGLTPLILYNVRSGGTIDNIFNNLDESYYGVDNANIGENLRERVRQAPLVYESGFLRELGGLFHNPVAREWLYISGISCLLAAVMMRKQRGVRLFIVLLVILMIVQSIFTSTRLWFHHFAIILPFMVMMSAAGALALVDILQYLTQKSETRYLVAGLLIALIALDMLTLWQYHDALRRTGGIATYSAVIYDLVDELDSYPPGYPVAALDWGISPAVTTLTESRIVPNEVFGYDWQPDPGFAVRLAPFLVLDESLYILHVPGETVFPRRDDFMRIAAENHRDPILVQTLFDWQGNPYFEIWRTVSEDEQSAGQRHNLISVQTDISPSTAG